MHSLRDGSSTRDRRLDRLTFLDPRSLDYRVTRLLRSSEVRTKVWTLPRTLYGDQGQEGACVEFGLSHVLACRPLPQWRPALLAVRAEHLIYWPSQVLDPFPGGEYPGARPQEGGTSEVTALKVLRDTGAITSFSWANGVDEAIAGVVNAGPANLALAWTDGMMEASSDGLIRDTGPVVGGHDVAMIGVQLRKPIDGRRVDVAVIAQSWGLDYGDRGRVYLPLEDLDRRLRDDGTCAFVHGEALLNVERMRAYAKSVVRS